MRRELACTCVYHLECGLGRELRSASRYPCKRGIGESELLCLKIIFFVQRLACVLQFEIDEVPDLCKEPQIDLGVVMDLLYRYASSDGLGHIEQSLVGHLDHACFDVFVRQLRELIELQCIRMDLSSSYGLHQGALKGVGYRHDLACRLHLRAEVPLRIYELIEGPLRELDRHIVECGLESRICVSRYGIDDLVEPVAQRDLGSDLRDRVARRLGSECGRSGYSRVYLYYRIFK